MMASKMLVILTINNNEDDFHDDGCTHGERGGRESGEPQAAEKMELRCLQRNRNWVDHVGDYDNYYNDNDNKVNRCLARYSPRATTTNRPTTGH